MTAKNQHWTERSVDDFVSRITFDFTTQIEQAVGSQAELAQSLGVTKGRVSQILSSQSISLKNVVRYARAIGRKVAVVLYDDSDPENSNGPVNSQVFSTCWERAGKPNDFFDLEATTAVGQHAWIRECPVFGMPSQNSAYITYFNCIDNLDWASSLGASMGYGRVARNEGAALKYYPGSATTPNRTLIQ